MCLNFSMPLGNPCQGGAHLTTIKTKKLILQNQILDNTLKSLIITFSEGEIFQSFREMVSDFKN